MCGIIGIISKNKSEINYPITKAIQHRGPDADGLFEDDFIALGHRRLSIQDLSENANQPMYSHDGRYVMIFNGEIYNHLDIRKKIEDKYPFRSTGDSETLLYAYIEYGSDIIKQLNGIFAFAIYDTLENDLFIARDQFGIKPLYYYFDNDKFIFSSEIKAITSQNNINKALNYESFVNYINFLWSPGTNTPFTKIHKLLGGNYIKLNVKKVNDFTIEKYYEIPFNGKYSDQTEEALIEELDQRLLKAVERQLLSDVPVGFFLSGGLDSSAIVAMAKRLFPDKQFPCYTIDTEGKANEGFSDDLHYAKIVAKHLDVKLHIVKADIDIVKDFDKMIYHLDEPQADPAPLNVLNICREARKNGDIVLLGGTAGDDLFSGYRRHQVLAFEKYFKYFPSFMVKAVKFLTNQLNVQNPTVRRIRKLINDLDKSQGDRMAGYFSWLPLATNKSLFSKTLQSSIKDYNPSKYLLNLLKNIPNEQNNLNKMLFWEMKTFLCDHNLNYTDKLSMAEGIEVRVPFLDLELVEFSTRIPPNLKLKGKTTKYILKKVMEKYLPHEVIYRSKAGFGAPVRQWIINDLDSVISDYLSKENIEKRAIFDYDNVQKLIKDNKDGKIDASYSIWSLLAIESWLRQFSDNEYQSK